MRGLCQTSLAHGVLSSRCYCCWFSCQVHRENTSVLTECRGSIEPSLHHHHPPSPDLITPDRAQLGWWPKHAELWWSSLHSSVAHLCFISSFIFLCQPLSSWLPGSACIESICNERGMRFSLCSWLPLSSQQPVAKNATFSCSRKWSQCRWSLVDDKKQSYC